MNKEVLSDAYAKAKRVRSARMLAGLKRQDLQERYSIHENTLKLWEKPSPTGKGLTEKGAKRLIDALKAEGIECTVQWLLTGYGEGPRLTENDNIEFGHIEIPLPELNQDLAILKEVQFFQDINKETMVLLITDNNMAPFFQIGDYVGGYKRQGKEIMTLVNLDCIVELKDGTMLVCRISPTKEEGFYNIAQISVDSSLTNKKISGHYINSAALIIWHRKKDYTYLPAS